MDEKNGRLQYWRDLRNVKAGARRPRVAIGLVKGSIEYESKGKIGIGKKWVFGDGLR